MNLGDWLTGSFEVEKPEVRPRWEFRDDRLELRRWLMAPRSGYRADVDEMKGTVTLKIRRQFVHREPYSGERRIDYMGPPREAWNTIDLVTLVRSALGWRGQVARELMTMRRFVAGMPKRY